MMVEQEIEKLTSYTTEEIEHGEAKVSEGALDLSSEDPEEPHVSDVVKETNVQEQRREESEQRRVRGDECVVRKEGELVGCEQRDQQQSIKKDDCADDPRRSGLEFVFGNWKAEQRVSSGEAVREV